MNKRNYLIIFLILLSLAVVSTAVANERIMLPGGLFYYQPAASVFGSEAVWVNPAGLGSFKMSSYQLMFDADDNSFAKSWGSVVNREGIGMAIRHLDNPTGDDYQEYVFAIGFPTSGDLNMGASYRYFKEGPGGYNHSHFWNIGFSGNLDQGLKWGAVFSNLNRGKINGFRTEIEMRYSLAYRLKKIPLTFACDMFLSTGTKIKHADFVYFAEYSPTPGLYLNAQVDNSKNFTLGIRANFLQYFVGNKSSFDDQGSHVRSIMYVGGTSMRQPTLIKDLKRTLSVTMKGVQPENPTRPVFGASKESFLTYLMQIHRAADDPSIDGMVLQLDRLKLGFAQAQELRNALSYFRSKKKLISCFVKYPTNISYYVATACDKIYIPDVSQLQLTGLRAELTFYGGLLNKLGLQADMMRIGDYKTVPEQYTDTSASIPNREQLNRELDRLYEQFVDGLARSRSLSSDSVKTIIDNGPYTSAEALQYGLVDSLGQEINKDKSCLSTINMTAYIKDTVANAGWWKKPVVAVLVADGEIAFTKNGLNPLNNEKVLTPGEISKGISQIKKETDVKAVLLRVDSPGGDALAGEEIYRSLKEINHLGVSFGNMAASGGYYIATPGTFISASPGTVTGSIGIFGGKLNAAGLYEKLGINKELYLRGRFSGMMSTIRPFTDDEREKYFSQMKSFYTHFVQLVSTNRNIPVDSIDNLGQGRVWIGNEAAINGLVDNTAGFMNAVKQIAEERHLEEYTIKLYPENRPLFQFPGKSMFSPFVKLLSGTSDEDETDVFDFEDYSGIFSRLPFDISIQ